MMAGGCISTFFCEGSALLETGFKSETWNTLWIPTVVLRRYACEPIGSIISYFACTQSNFFDGRFVFMFPKCNHTLSPGRNLWAGLRFSFAKRYCCCCAAAIAACAKSLVSVSFATSRSPRAIGLSEPSDCVISSLISIASRWYP